MAAYMAGMAGVGAVPPPGVGGVGAPPPPRAEAGVPDRLEVLIGVVNALGVEIMGLKREVEALREENGELREEVRALNAEIVELRRENAALAAQVVELNQKVAQLQSQLDREKADNAALRNQISQLYAQIAHQVPEKKRRHGLGKLLHRAEKVMRPIFKAAAPHLLPALAKKLARA